MALIYLKVLLSSTLETKNNPSYPDGDETPSTPSILIGLPTPKS